MGEDKINPDFKTSIFCGMKPLTEEGIINELKANSFIFRKFKSKGLIHSKDYSFITKVTFSDSEKNCVEGKKNKEEILQAEQNLKIVEDYFNNYEVNKMKKFKVRFVQRNDNECALYNPDRFNNKHSLQVKLEEIFS